MALLAMPMLVINMGGEMIYILDQRLKAQSIPAPKSAQVLQDVAATMYHPKFVDEMFKRQTMYDNDSVRQIFRRLAHSSIMRLNESSMDKLYDLMTMGFKYQILTCCCAKDLLQITLNHLETLLHLFPNEQKASSAAVLIERTKSIILKVFGAFTDGEFATLRYSLCRFFQDRKIKISLFLQGNVQTQGGNILISHQRRGSLPNLAQPIGTVQYMQDKEIMRTEFLCQNNDIKVNVASNGTSQSRQVSKPGFCELGNNIYQAGNEPVNSEATSPVAEAKLQQEEKLNKRKSSIVGAKSELNLLANLISNIDVSDPNAFKLHLDFDVNDSSFGAISPAENPNFNQISLDTNQSKPNLFEEVEVGQSIPEEEDDLLALMDEAMGR